MKLSTKLTIVFLLFLWHDSALAQVINIEEKRIKNTNDSVHWYGAWQANLNVSKEKQQIITFGTDLQLEYKNGKHLVLSLTNLELIKAGNNDLLNNKFQHLRYNYKWLPRVSSEVFGQVQSNPIQALRSRVLMGFGVRFKAFESKKHKARMYIGTSLMREKDEYKGFEYKVENRISIYISMTYEPNAQVSFHSTTYSQPLMIGLNNTRWFTQNTIDLKINKRLSFNVAYTFRFDPSLPEGIIKQSYRLANGIKYKF